MPDYSQGKIYEIRCNVTDEVYFGSTAEKYLSTRLGSHRNDTARCSSKQIINRGNFTCKIIENYPCKSRIELQIREGWWIENNVCINKHIPFKVYIQWCKDNNKRVQCYEKNRKIIDKQKKEGFKCECGGTYTRVTKLIHCNTKKHLDYVTNK
tara:strand:+ start:46 stop:504 length:459 start_codon:yes stop_codon:yes gene_type:complete